MTHDEQWDALINEIREEIVQSSMALSEALWEADHMFAWSNGSTARDVMAALREAERHKKRLVGALHCRGIGMSVERWLEDQRQFPITGGFGRPIR